MCRWLAYIGEVLLDELYKPKNSLSVQSLHSRLSAETTNGDGFGVGWYRTHTRVLSRRRTRQPRAALAGAHLLGVAIARYVVRIYQAQPRRRPCVAAGGQGLKSSSDVS